MEFLPDISKLIQILLRWGHVFFAILWVGTSFTFNYLDNKLPKNSKEDGIEASGILQHSGYYYKLTRFRGAPTEIPKNVILWKYTSYLTFLSGVALLILIYYVNANILMIDKRVNTNISPTLAIAISVFSIIGSWLVYDVICKSKLINYKIIFPIILLCIGTAATFGLTKIYGSRFSFLQSGIILGSIMTFNVFNVIAPNGRKIALAALNKKKFDLNLSIQAKIRSVHNNIITLLVLFIMLSGHASYIWANQYNWLILSILAVIFSMIQYYVNWKNKKESN
tara:strand:+ start:1808 stop:2650 length:843 start_codon:yes stop_codon:yes gene_type:complete